MWGVLKKIKIMIRDWRQINENNVNDPVPGYLGKVGRTWIMLYSSDEDENGMRHVMSLKPHMGPEMPHNLILRPKCLRIYIEYGGDFNRYISCNAYEYSNKLEQSMRFLFEQGAHPPDFQKVPLWIKKVYQEVQRKGQNCRKAYAALHLLRLSPWGRPQRDILGMVLHQIWDTRINNEWEL